MDSDDVKWKSVETTSREILYYTNKITGQQKWTNKNCHCSKPKNPLQPTSPCCYKKPRKGWTDHSYARREIRSSLTKNLYCLSDIVNEVKKNYHAKEHRKHLRRKNSITLDFKKKLITTEDPKFDVRATKDPAGNDKTTEKSKEDVIFDINLENEVNASKDLKNNLKTATNDNNFPKDLKNDVISTLDLKNDSLSSEVTKNDVTAKDDPLIISEESNDLVDGFEDIKNDFNAVDVIINNVTAVNDSKLRDVTVTADRERDVIEAKDSDFNDVNVVKDITTDKENDVSDAKDSNDVLSKERNKTNDDITEDMEIDVTAIDNFNNDVTVVKDPTDSIVTANKENDVVEPKDSTHAISAEPNKIKEKINPHKRGVKRKREVSDNVNGYKGRLRVRRNNIKITLRRKYRRRKPLNNAVGSTELAQSHISDTLKNPNKKIDSKAVLQTECDLIEQSIIEIDRYTSAYSVTVNKPSSNLGSEHLRSKGAESGAPNASTGGIENSPPRFNSTSPDLRMTSEKDRVRTSEFPVEVSQPRFVDEKFVRMNIQFENLAKVEKKASRKSEMLGSVEKEHPFPGRKRKKVSHTVVTSEPSSCRPVVTQMKSPRHSASSSRKSVSSMTMNLSSYMSEAGTREAVSQADGNGNSKAFLSPNFANTIKSSSSSSKCNFPPNQNRTQRSLNEIVNCMNSSSKVEVPMTSTVSKMNWSAVLSKESKKGTQSRPDARKNDLSDNDTSLNTKQIDGINCANNVGAEYSESESSEFGHVEDAIRIANVPQTPSIEPASQGGSQLSSGCTHNSITPGSRRSEAARKKEKTRETGTNTNNPGLVFQTPEQLSNVTEVPANYVDLSWRIVTSNDGHSSSLSNFFKLVPITIARGPSCTVDNQEPMSFLGVPIHGGPAVIAKILNTSAAQNCNEIFKVSRRPNIKTAGTYVKKSTLSFVWERDTVLVNSESLKAGNLSGKDVKPRPPLWIDICNRVSIVLPKPLRLPEAGNVVYLGDFNVKVDCVEFVVTHSVVVTSSPRPSLTVPSGTPVNSTSTVAIRCRAPGKAKNDAETAKKVSVGRKPAKGGMKTFQKCVFCGTHLKCRKDVKIHRKLHADFVGTKCSECKRRFHNGGRLSVHLDTHKCTWLHICAICKKPYRTPKFLTPIDLAKDYYKMCLPCRRKELKCKKCSERSLSFEDLEVHLKEKHGLYCPICKSSFLFKRDLAKHMHVQHGILGVPPSSSTNKS